MSVKIAGGSSAPNDAGLGVTARLGARLADLQWNDVTFDAATVAKQCLLDWMGVALGGRNEPLVGILHEEFPEPGACSVIGARRTARLQDAVLINGSLSHALDFDDVVVVMGHPSAPVAPVALGLAELQGATGREALLAFIAGVETACRVGALMGPSHYARGWHGTATYGTFGAMAAAAKLLSLDSAQIRHAFGLAGTQAAGLKSVFGTMSKPLHAGKAAQNGLLAARLASRGFTSDPDILDSDQGFAAVQSTSLDQVSALAAHPRGFYVTEALFKYHAACFLTHEAIDAANALRSRHGVTTEQIAGVRVRVGSGHMGVCNIPEPRTGLECKFSLRMTVAMALAGEDTFQENLFSDHTARREDLVALRRCVTVSPDVVGEGSVVEIELRDGRTLEHRVDLMKPEMDLVAQQARIERKFRHLAEPAVGAAVASRIIETCRNLEAEPDVSGLMALCSRA